MVTFIKAPFKAVGKYVTKTVKTGETKKNWLGQEKEESIEEKVWEQTGFSDCEIDGEQFAERIDQKMADIQAEGGQILGIIPIQSGQYDYKAEGIKSRKSYSILHNATTEKVSGGASFGYGFSFTAGVLIHYEMNA